MTIPKTLIIGADSTYSINLLWILISNISQVFEPSPQGVFLVEILRFLVGNLTGPLTLRSLLRARSISSLQTIASQVWLTFYSSTFVVENHHVRQTFFQRL